MAGAKKGRGPGGTGGTSGVRDGMDATYYPNGQLREKGRRVAGKKHGKWIVYHNDGKVWSTGTYDHGVAHGMFKWNADNGVVRQQGRFENGKQSGTWKRYHGGTGKLFDVAVWKDGKRVKVTSYKKDGSIKKRA